MVRDTGAVVEVYAYDKPSYTGVSYPASCIFPSWKLDEEHILCRTAAATYRGLFRAAPQIGRWIFSTNGTVIMGEYGIPCIGFGPGKEEEAHAPNEKTFKEHLVKAAAMYAALPGVYAAKKR